MDDKKVFRDPVYNLVSFDKRAPFDVLLKLIDCPEFQRLRRIRQLGFSYITYPSAVHDRFSHSIGVAYLAGEIIDRLNGCPDEISIQDPDLTVNLPRSEFRLLLQIAGLLHDIGHGPFSHAFEKSSGIDHEEMGVKIIRDERTGVNQALRNVGSDLLKPHIVRWVSEIIEGTFNVGWARDLISGQIDADRMDYLNRDAYMCGVPYARFDRQWLLNNMYLMKIPHEDRNGIVLNGQKGIYALESFIISRYHMYEQVYFHKTTRGMEQIVGGIFKRARHLISENHSVAFIEESIAKVFRGEYDFKDYLALDDFNVLSQVKTWTNHPDVILSTLCKAIIYRKPFKMFKEIKDSALFSREEYRRLDQVFEDRHYADYFFVEDDYINNPYKDDYLLGKEGTERAGHIWLLAADGSVKELAEESVFIGAVRNRSAKRMRGYLHRDYLSLLEGGSA